MGYPAIRSYTSPNYDDDGTSTTHTIQLPADILAGDYIVVIFALHRDANIQSRSITWPGGWYPFVNGVYSNETHTFAGYIIANGTEDGSTITITSSSGATGLWASYALYNVAAAPEGTYRSVPSLAVPEPLNPSSCTHSYGAAEYLTIEGLSTQDIPITNLSSGYSGSIYSDWFGVGTSTTTSATEDPAAISGTNYDGYSTVTIMVPGIFEANSSFFFGDNF